MTWVVILLLLVLGLVGAGFLATVKRGSTTNAPEVELGAEERSRLVRLRKIAAAIGDLKASAGEGTTASIVASEAQGEADHVIEEANRLLMARRVARTAVQHGAGAEIIGQIDARLDTAEEALGTIRTELAKAVAQPESVGYEGLEDRIGQLKALNETLRELKA